jgi:hypothetical protein
MEPDSFASRSGRAALLALLKTVRSHPPTPEFLAALWGISAMNLSPEVASRELEGLRPVFLAEVEKCTAPFEPSAAEVLAGALMIGGIEVADEFFRRLGRALRGMERQAGLRLAMRLVARISSAPPEHPHSERIERWRASLDAFLLREGPAVLAQALEPLVGEILEEAEGIEGWLDAHAAVLGNDPVWDGLRGAGRFSAPTGPSRLPEDLRAYLESQGLDPDEFQSFTDDMDLG